MVSSEAEAFAHPAVVARLAGMAAEIDSLRVLVAALEAESVALRDRLSVPLKTPENSSVQKRFVTHRRGLLTFLHHPEVPPTNNASERSLRPSVVHRKVTGGFRHEAWATAYAALRTVADTARKRGQPIFSTVLKAAGTPLPAPA